MQHALPLAAPRTTTDGPLAGLFHPAVADWFLSRFGAPTPVQLAAWQVTARRGPALITAPTGSGKTLAAFLAAINELVVDGVEQQLVDATQVLYISPLKALSNDIQRNLEAPLAGIADTLRRQHLPVPEIRSAVRTGDTSPIERARMKRVPPHILVTTPESLFILLGSDSGREMLKTVRSVIVDELHAVAGGKRGAHLALSLERLDALCEQPPVRIGLSATQKPIETMARLLMGAGAVIAPSPRDDGERAGVRGHTARSDIEAPHPDPLPADAGRGKMIEIVDAGHVRERDLALELPRSPLSAVLAAEVWAEIYDRLAELAKTHRTTLIFVNQRRMAERVARHLAERIGEEHVGTHHGSLSKEHRLIAEQKLKHGQLRALVATSSLELGIDIGDIDLVCQIGSPRGINAFLQRVGRAGHAVNAIPKGRLFPQSLDDLAECVALLGAVRSNELDRTLLPDAPLDVLAQQIVAEVCCAEWELEALHARFIRALPYAQLPLARFEAIVQMLADGYATKRGRGGALLHYDAVNRRLRGRRGARQTSLMNAGVIPDQFDYEVELLPDQQRVGTLNEDFAFESLPGDIVQLGNTSYRILKVETGRVLVEDAKGQPPNMPFWFGEAPGRSDELSIAVSKLRAFSDAVLRTHAGADAAVALHEALRHHYGLDANAASQLAHYYASVHTALGLLPTRDRIVFERFFDEVGDTHLVIHAPLGSRLMRAWGLALRKRFCRQFNFELQAAALDDSLVLSLGPTHSFPLADVAHYLHSNSAREVLVQAVLQAPMFATRWRWAASVALAVARIRNGKRVPPQFQRSDAEDLLTHAFPDAVACPENLPGDRDVPEHPLVQQALADCLHEVMDVDGMLALLKRIETGSVEIVCRDLTAPSPLSESILNAKPYAFLDDGAAEERRTLAVKSRAQSSSIPDAREARDLGRLDAAAIARVDQEMRPDPGNADELHDALVVHGFLTEEEAAPWASMLTTLIQARRVARLCADESFSPSQRGEGARRADEGRLHDDHRAEQPLTPTLSPRAGRGGAVLFVAAERLREMRALLPDAALDGDAPQLGTDVDRDTALREIIRSRLEGLGPITAAALAAPLGIALADVDQALLALEQRGSVMRGAFSDAALTDGRVEWCERRRLARIHRYTRDTRRASVEPVPPAALMRFLLHWQGLTASERREGPDALFGVIEQLEGLPVAAGAWEGEVLPARLRWYEPHWLDQLCASGQVVWQRPAPDISADTRRSAPVRATPILLLPRAHAAHWQTAPDIAPLLSTAAQDVLAALRAHGASFFSDLAADTGLLRAQLETTLGELVSHGLVSADGFAGLRALVAPGELKARRLRRGVVHGAFAALESGGRWSLVGAARANSAGDDPAARTEHVVRTLLRRYGVVFRRLVEREPQLPPWRELFYVLRRLEARGEIRGGRFVSGFSGEQFALPEAATSLRRCRDDDAQLVVLSGHDPLNLSGSVLPGERLAAQPGNRLLLRGGAPVAVISGGEPRWLIDADAETQAHWRDLLIRRRSPGSGAAPATTPGTEDDTD